MQGDGPRQSPDVPALSHHARRARLRLDETLGLGKLDAAGARLAQSELAPHVAEWYDEGTLPDGLGPMLGKLGLLGMHLEGYGCAGTSATAYVVACRELEAVDSGLRSFVSDPYRPRLPGRRRSKSAGPAW